MDLSIVIPTRNRRERILATLDALDRQRIDGAEIEIVVIDNGSSDGTYDVLAARSGKRTLMGTTELRKGATFARNRALELVRAPLVLLLADDMVPEGDGLIAGHLAAHREHPEPNYGVLGQVRWAEPVSPFMHWLEKAGFEPSFDDIAAGPIDPVAHLCSSHVSLKVEALRDAGGFDAENFPHLLADTELGVRLRRRGFVLDYRPDLLTRHHHHLTPRRYARRMRTVGRAARRLRDMYPDEAVEHITEPKVKGLLSAPPAIAGRALLAAGARGRLRERAWGAVLAAAYARGWKRH
jgi:GT2 family glycosyltransferase